jgi:hypothetical protein
MTKRYVITSVYLIFVKMVLVLRNCYELTQDIEAIKCSQDRLIWMDCAHIQIFYICFILYKYTW